MYPDLIVENNGLAFISNDGGETYNYCHCKFAAYFSFSGTTAHSFMHTFQSGQTSKLLTSISSARLFTLHTLISSMRRATSTTSAGATPPCTASPLRSFYHAHSYISSTTSATNTRLFNTARKALCILTCVALAIASKTMVSVFVQFKRIYF